MLFNGSTSSGQQPNQITTKNTIAANGAGISHQVSFLGAEAVYQSPSGGNDHRRHAWLHYPRRKQRHCGGLQLPDPAFAGASNPFTAGGFSYVGDGVVGVTMEIIGRGNNSQFGDAVDNFAITAVPEPASTVLLGLGAAGITVTRRRKRV